MNNENLLNEFIDENDDNNTEDDEVYIYEFPEEVTDADVHVAVSKYNLILLGRTKSIINKNGDGVFIKGHLSQLSKFADEYLGLMLNEDFLCEEECFDYEDIFKVNKRKEVK